MGSAQDSNPTTANIWSLPPEVRIAIYKHLLPLDGALLLFQASSSRVKSFRSKKPRQWLALFYTNKRLHAEATPLLYSSIKFTLAGTIPAQADILQIFCHGIGPRNASFLSHLCIGFPLIESPDHQKQNGDEALCADSLRIFKLLRERCVNLKTLEMFVHHHKLMGLATEEPANHVPDALLQVDAHVRTVASLNAAIVRVYDRTMPASVERQMRELGWVIVEGEE